MIFNYNNIIIFNTINSLSYYLDNNIELVKKKQYNNYCFHIMNKDNILLGINNYEKKYNIRIWKNNDLILFNSNDIKFNNNNLLCCLDYKINDNNIEIDYYYLNDKILNDKNINLLNKSLLNYIYKIGNINNIHKITMEVHYLLKNYNKYLYNENFILKYISNDNPFWIRIEKYL